MWKLLSCVVAIGIVARPSTTYAQEHLHLLRDIVGVGIMSDGAAVLATETADAQSDRWRTDEYEALNGRAIERIDLALLSRSGTKMLIEAGGRRYFIDLTASGWPQSRLRMAQHLLGSRDLFGVQRGREFQVYDDGDTRINAAIAPALVISLAEGETAQLNQTLGLVSIRSDGHMFTRALTLKDGRISEGDRIDLGAYAPLGKNGRVVGGIAGGALTAALVVDRDDHFEVHAVGARVPTLVYRGKNASAVASLAAAMLVSIPWGRAAEVSAADPDLQEEYLAGVIAQANADSKTTLTFQAVTPDPRLYAPILMLAADEPMLPSSIDIWNDSELNLKQSKTYKKFDDWKYVLNAYGNMSRRESSCVVYYRSAPAMDRRVYSYPGSWVIEYWLYYPFDLYGLDQHMHDPEHLFVEIDKLSGRVHRVFGAAHGRTTSNNVFEAKQTLMDLQLPLYALVERGKHATAVDVNHDGLFTAGIDENGAGERSFVWGIRDATGATDDALQPYESGMMVRRHLKDAVMTGETKTVWAPVLSSVADQPKPVCGLEPLPAAPKPLVTNWKETATRDAALTSMYSNGDAKNPREIFKEWSFPIRFVRAGYVRPKDGWRGLSLDLVNPVSDFVWFLTFGRVEAQLPGRIAFGLDINSRKRQVETDLQSPRAEWTLQPHVFYERLSSNLFGYYVGVEMSGDGERPWYTAGTTIEFPDMLLLRTNASLHLGVSFRETGGIRLDFRAHVGLSKQVFKRFGIDRNPK